VILYQGEELLAESADHAEFIKRLGAAVVKADLRPFVAVRDGGDRILVAVHEGRLMLEFVFTDGARPVSKGATYEEGEIQFTGLRSTCTTKAEHFVDAPIGMAAIEAFFSGRRMSDEIDLAGGLPDDALLDFPEPMPERPRPASRVMVRRSVEVPPTLAADMHEVCTYVDGVAGDPDVSIDFDDAIQIGDLCGGRTKKAEQFEFSYYPGTGETWLLELGRQQMDDIASGKLAHLTIEVLTSTPAPGDVTVLEQERHPWNLPDLPLEEACEKLHALEICDIEPTATRDEVVQCLGEPTHTGGATHDSLLGYTHPWVKYHLPQCQLRFEFEDAGELRSIMFLPPDWEPGK
jgi:hypothetical protein